MKSRVGLLVVVAIFAAVVYAWPEQHAKSEKVPVLIDLQPEQVRRIAVESGDKHAEVVNEGEGTWVAQPGTPSLDATIMFQAEKHLFPMLAYRAVKANISNPQYGLANPEITFTVRARSGATYRIIAGAQSFNEGGFYAARPGGHTVYLIARRAMDDMRSLAAGQQIDTPTRVTKELKRLDEEVTQEQTKPDVSPWLQQVLDTGAGPAPNEVQERSPEEGK